MPITYTTTGVQSARYCAPRTAASRSAWHGTSTPGRTQPAIACVAAQFGNKITLEQVASLCRLSTSQFCRVFKHEQGISFGQYLLHYRLERACERLGSPDVLAKEVAYSVGFNDLSYFTWAFKRQMGVCPSHYIDTRQAQDRPNA
ncbi:MAG: AraC family transcriptional regulator [Burkholderiaceae bacterium]